MDLSLTEQQQLLQATASDFVRHEAPGSRAAEWAKQGVAFVPELWRQASEMGWLGMVTPVEYGGAGASLTDAAVVFQELGRAPLPGPFFTSGVLAPLLLQEGGTEAQQDRYLPPLAQGRHIATVALQEPFPKYGPEWIQLRADRRNGGFVLDGTKLWVLGAEQADTLICAARTSEGENPTDGITLLLVDRSAPGVSVRAIEGFMSGACEVVFSGVEAPASSVLGETGRGWEVLERATLKAIPVLCAYQVGGCQEVFDFTAEYTRTRVVFSQPIGRFQRVQDHVVELSLHMDAARWTTNEALWKVDTNRPDAKGSVHLAKAMASEGYARACDNSLEVHAGVGTDRSHPLYPHLIQSRTLYPFLGDPRYHKRRMADAWDM